MEPLMKLQRIISMYRRDKVGQEIRNRTRLIPGIRIGNDIKWYLDNRIVRESVWDQLRDDLGGEEWNR